MLMAEGDADGPSRLCQEPPMVGFKKQLTGCELCCELADRGPPSSAWDATCRPIVASVALGTGMR